MNVVVLLAYRGKKKPTRDLKPSELGRPLVGGGEGESLPGKNSEGPTHRSQIKDRLAAH